MSADVQDIEDLLDALTEAGDGEDVSLRDIHDEIGGRSFGPLLLAPGLVALTPAGGVPGLPSLLAAVVILVAAQLAIGRQGVWLPEVLLDRRVRRERLSKAAASLQKPARFVDRMLRPRLPALTGRAAARAAGLACVALALMIPFLELLPFAVAAPAGAIALFGLAMIARDGAVMAAGFGLAAASLGLALYALL